MLAPAAAGVYLASHEHQASSSSPRTDSFAGTSARPRARAGEARRAAAGRVERRGSVRLARGGGGIGKTRVLDATAQIARERGFTVLSAAAQELEAHRPFAVVADCLRVDLCEFTRAEELLALVEAETARSPVMFVLDDLQWADPSSLAFLGRLALERPPAGSGSGGGSSAAAPARARASRGGDRRLRRRPGRPGSPGSGGLRGDSRGDHRR